MAASDTAYRVCFLCVAQLAKLLEIEVEKHSFDIVTIVKNLLQI